MSDALKVVMERLATVCEQAEPGTADYADLNNAYRIIWNVNERQGQSYEKDGKLSVGMDRQPTDDTARDS